MQVAKITTAGDEESKTVSSKEIHTALAQMDMQKIKDDFSDRNKGGLFSTLDYCKEEGECNLDIQVYLMPIVDSKGKELNKLSCMCFFYRSYDDVDLIKLQTIEASHSIFSVAIERKKAEAVLKTKLDELQQRNEELQQIQQQLIESEKLASLGQLSAGVAHEINNPVGFVLSNLTTMVGYMEELAEAMAPLGDKELGAVAKLSQWQQKSQEYETDYLLEDSAAILKSSINGLERVKTIVSDLGSFARMDTDELTEVDINQVIHSSLNILNNELKYDHKVVLDLQPNLAILGNDGQLQQVFINFFVNAKHAMPDGGHLWITSKKVRERVIVSIKDEGHGIPPAKVKEIFTPFFTTKPPGEGTGLGLSISYSILQRHHAKIKVNSVVDEGTEFLLSFVPSL